MTAPPRSIAGVAWAWPRRLAIALVLAGSLLIPLSGGAASATGAAGATTSYYESSASPSSLYQQGKAAGESGAQGLVVLDFGRPASNGTSDGVLDFARSFVSFASLRTGVQNFVMGYYLNAPDNTKLDIAAGTNDSCGVGQPCGGGVCGCPSEPASYLTWGHELAATVEQLGSWSAGVASSNGFTDTVHIVAGDDAEPAFDPGYNNTDAVMRGYAQAVGGSYPPMIDYGSADPGIWSNAQLLQIANGYSPNVAVPEMYTATQIGEWAALVSYAKSAYGEHVTLYGVMTTAAGSVSPQGAVSQTLGALASITGQGSIGWVSAITH